MGAHTEPFAELRLTGERFDDAHFPVDALHEIIRYQQLIIAAAQATWIAEHDGEKPTANLGARTAGFGRSRRALCRF